jgi:hypothetical protein
LSMLQGMGIHFSSAGPKRRPPHPPPPQAGDTKRAIDCCVLLNQWDQGVTLAQQHNFPQVGWQVGWVG